MDPGEFFRKFLGLPRKLPPSDRSDIDIWNFPSLPSKNYNQGPQQDEHFPNQHDDENGARGRGHRFGFSFGGQNIELDDMFEHFHGNMSREMESLQRQMEEMMKGFGVTEFFPGGMPSNPETPDKGPPPKDGQDHNGTFIWSNVPSPFFSNPVPSKKSPRDLMLKDGEEEEFKQPTEHLPPSFPNERDGSRFRNLFPFHCLRRPQNEKRGDSDLDGKVGSKEMVDLIKKPSTSGDASQRPSFFSSGSSVTMTTVRGADGKMEQKRVVRDSSGREETTVTRSLGDQTHSVTTITENDGQQEKKETFQNIKEDDVSKFQETWSKKQSESRHPNDSLFVREPRLHHQDRDIFSLFFGNSWR